MNLCEDHELKKQLEEVKRVEEKSKQKEGGGDFFGQEEAFEMVY